MSNWKSNPPITSSNQSKGKQKESSSTEASTSSASSSTSHSNGTGTGIGSRLAAGLGGLSLNGIAPTASDLNSILASGGKAIPSSSNSSSYSSTQSISTSQQFTQNQSSSLSQSQPQSHSTTTFRSSQPSTSNHAHAQSSTYQDFSQQPTGPNLQNPHLAEFSPYKVGPIRSAMDLDPGLHAHAQAYRDTQDLETSWNQIQDQINHGFLNLEDPAYHDAWASSIPAPTFDHDLQNRTSASHDTMAGRGVEDFMSLLSKDESEIKERSENHPNITSEWKPPSPSQNPSIMEEQLGLHKQLSELQDSEMRKSEGLKPADDEEHLAEGIYAQDPVEAFKAIWEGDKDRRKKFETINKEQNGILDEKKRELLKSYLPRGDWIDVSTPLLLLFFASGLKGWI